MEIPEKRKRKQTEKQLEEEDDKEDLHKVPPHYKAYTVQDHKILFEQTKRLPKEGDKKGFDGPAKVKEVNLAE